MGQALKVIKFDAEDNSNQQNYSFGKLNVLSHLMPLRIAAIVTAILGIVSLVLEVKIYFQFRYEIYLARLFPTIFSLLILILLQTKFGKKNHISLTHIFLFLVLSSISFVGYKLPTLFNYNLIGASIFFLTLSLFIVWGRKNQIIAVSYFILLFLASSILGGVLSNLNDALILSTFTSIALLVLSIVANSVIVAESDNRQISDSNNYDEDSIDINYLNGSLLPLFKCNLNGYFVYMNVALKEILELPVEKPDSELNFFDYVLKNERVKNHFIKKIESKGKVENYRLIFTGNNNSQKVLLLDCRSNIINDSVYLEGSLRDITEQYKKDKLLRAELEELKLGKKQNKNIIPSIPISNKRQANVLSKMGHELRTPMNSVLGFLTLIENGLFENEQELKEFSHSAKLSAESLLALMNDVVEISKLQDGAVEIVKTEFNLNDEINKIITTLSPHLGNEELKIVTKFDEQLPEVIISDPSKYSQVLTNLLRNAIQVSEFGEIIVNISCKKGIKNKYRLITKVKDTGNGIGENELYNLLNFNLDNLEKDEKVTANILHIMISRELTSLMEGEFTGASEIGDGTEFQFEIEIEEKLDISSDSNTETNSIDPNYKSKAKLLLVEDNPISRKVEQKLLQEAGYDVDCVDNAAEAIDVIQARDYDLVLMDIELKGVNGLEATQKIRLLEPPTCNIPIIAVTAHSSMKDREKCLVAGMNDYISKPINITFLKMTIDQWIQQVKSN